MKRRIFNTGIGLAFLSIVLGISYLLYLISENYVLNVGYCLEIFGIGVILICSNLIGNEVVDLLKEPTNAEVERLNEKL